MRLIEKYLYVFLATNAILISIAGANNTRELPGENDDFEKIRADNKVYVDKSEYITKLLDSGDKYFCMCRPARFGKSIFLQMLDAYFSGRKESFSGLAINEKHDWRWSYPVIHLDFSTEDAISLQKFSARLNNEIVRIGSVHGVQIDEKLPLYPAARQDFDKLPDSNQTKLGRLMHHLTQNWTNEHSVVVLIDEYDYPKRRNSPLYLRYMPTPSDGQDSNLELYLNPFFYELERVKRFVKFLFMTCTTKVSYHYRTKYPDTPITLKDLTYESPFSKMIGLTGAELQADLEPHIAAMSNQQPNETFHTLVRKLRKRYNGYCFSRDNTSSESDCRLFNFHSVMSSLRDKNVDFMWHPGAEPRYDIINNVTTMTEGDEIFNVFSNRSPNNLTISRHNLENAFGVLPSQEDPTGMKPSMRAFLVLYGYLTFKGYNEQTDEFVVDFPNEEMHESFRRSVLRYVVGRDVSSNEFGDICKSLLTCLITQTPENLVRVINDELLKPSMNQNSHVNFYYRFSGNRIAHVFGGCDELLKNVMKSKTFYREVVHRDPASDAGNNTFKGFEYLQKYLCDILVIRTASEITYTIKVELERSAACAINDALKTVNNEEVRKASRNHNFHVIGLNFNTEEGLIDDWISMTYNQGRFKDVKASQPRYVKMYEAYANHLEAYASMV